MTEWPFALAVCRDCGFKASQVQRRVGVDGSPPLCNVCCATYPGDDWLRRRLESGTRPTTAVAATSGPRLQAPKRR